MISDKLSNNQGTISEAKVREVATLAGGCFWCLEAIFSELVGVDEVLSGYSGGDTINPSYEQVSTGKTGHAEAIQILFYPKEISFRELLQIFFSTHDPTTIDRQGPDIGSQYRSAIFYHNEEQRATANKLIRELNNQHIWDKPIVTETKPFGRFYKAEEYHQKYYQGNPERGYCPAVINPKLAKFRKLYYKKLKNQTLRT
jgi:peptide-methionine (S)-S-oxide reductase